MDLLQSFILGMVQGLTEFLPISSSGHLVITHWLFGTQAGSLGFDVALHWGTLLAVIGYFRNDVCLIIRGFFHSLVPSKRELKENIYQKLSWLLILASIPGGIIGYLLQKQAESSLRNPLYVGLTMATFGLVLLAADRLGKKTKNLDRITWMDAVWIGLSQALAIFPGVSRSGSTIATGLFLGFKREDAARFSFLMSIPIIFGAGLFKLKDFNAGVTSLELIVGFLSAAFFGFLSIKYLLRYLAKHDYKVFGLYRLIVAVVVIAFYFYR